MMVVMGNFAFTADTRACFLCAHGGVTVWRSSGGALQSNASYQVRGFNGFACSFEDDLKDLLRESDNKTTCIAARVTTATVQCSL